MIILVKNHPYRYDMENISTIFFPYEKIRIFENSCDETDPVTVITEIRDYVLSVDATVYDKHKKKVFLLIVKRICKMHFPYFYIMFFPKFLKSGIHGVCCMASDPQEECMH